MGLTILTGAPAPMLLLISWGKSDGEVLEFYHGLTIGMVLAFPIAAIIICTAALGEERKARTMPFLILKPVPRVVIAAAVTTAAILSSFVVMAIGAGLTWLVAAAFTGNWTVGVGATVAIAITAMTQAALFVPIGFLISRATLVGLAYLLIWETILTTAVSGFSGSSTYRIALSAYADVATVDSAVADALNEALGKSRRRRRRRRRQSGRHGGHFYCDDNGPVATPRPRRGVVAAITEILSLRATRRPRDR